MPPPFDIVEILPKTDHRASVIWLHGLGADGHDFEQIVPELCIPDIWGIHYIFPNAPEQPVTVNGGYVMRAWYDILESSLIQKIDEAGIRASTRLITDIINNEIDQGIAPDKILLAGFSQGGVIALNTGLQFNSKLAGIVALSTYLPGVNDLIAQCPETSRMLPILFAHGSYDSVVPINRGKSAFNALRASGYSVSWLEYPMDHGVCIEEIEQISLFIRYHLQP